MEHSQPEYYGGAEAVLGLQPNSSISVAYNSLFGPHDDLILLELDDKLVPEVIHERVVLRGQPDEDAVLCTDTKTYAIKFVGTSNSVFLIPPSDKLMQVCNDKGDDNVVASVIKVSPGSMELVEIAPKLDRLRTLLSQNPYSFDEASEMDTVDEAETPKIGLYRWNDLTDMLQGSDVELRLGLQSLLAVEIDGYWRTLDDKYMNGILNMLLHDTILQDWSINALNQDAVLCALEADGYSRNIASHCLRVFCDKVHEDAGGSGIWTLNARRVCVHFAREILREGKMKLQIFVDEWIRKVPDGINASFDILEGEVLTEKIGVETWVYSFSVSSLPCTPKERFSILFRERLRWEWKDLEPFVRDLSVPGLTLEGLLLKYTRRTQPTVDAEPVFSAR
ncbi:hypothetical protein F511_32162 [Dorcoceras hygrometricum]|uniref:Sister chromatid cohesion protein DCC1 n=1 Tax=Dorcoceras hygrometricum TaxID=472368 RepID=A0A2Z7CYL4_9LAMI|nr:hypothetical protein F511_32162 [Dorcoceras hygrometricum]